MILYNSGHIPEEWKLANAVPIFEKGDKASVENDRPISLICLVMKVFERIVTEKLLSLTVDFLDNMVFLSKNIAQLIWLFL